MIGIAKHETVEISVGLTATSASTTFTNTFDITKSLLIIEGGNPSGTYNVNQPRHHMFAPDFTSLSGNNSNQVTVYRSNGGSASATYTVRVTAVQFSGNVTVQRGNLLPNTSTFTDVTISSVPTNKTFVYCNLSTTGGVTNADDNFAAVPTSSTNIRVYCTVASTAARLYWQAVTFDETEVTVAHYDADLFNLATDTVQDVTITSVDTSKSFIVGYYIGSSSNARSHPVKYFQNSTTVRLETLGANAISGFRVYFSVVEIDSTQVSAQHYHPTRPNGNNVLNQAITSVTTNKSLVLPCGGYYNYAMNKDGSGPQYSNVNTITELTSSTNLRLTSDGINGPVLLSATVFEILDADEDDVRVDNAVFRGISRGVGVGIG